MKKKIITMMLILTVCVNYYTIAFAKNKVETHKPMCYDQPLTGVHRIKHVLYVDYKRAAESYDLDELKKLVYEEEKEEGVLVSGVLTNVYFRSEIAKDGKLMKPDKYLLSTIKKYKIIDKVSEKGSNIYRKEYINGNLQSSSLIASRSKGGKGATTFRRPTTKGVLTSGFGPRWGRMHTGIDIGLDYGDDIYAAKSGIVKKAGYHGSYGYNVYIDHGHGVFTRYAHASELLVHEGDRVKEGQSIAKAGSTGNSTGVHLHFEIVIDDEEIDPLKYVKY